nr:hypothetical protein [Tanacetum cinerariifolium]
MPSFDLIVRAFASLGHDLDEFIKSSVETLVPNLSKFEDECECDVPDCDDSQTTNFLTFSNPLFDDSTSSDDESSHEEVIHKMSFKTYKNLFFDLDEEIISNLDSTPKNDRFDTESYHLESLLNHDALMASSLKIDSLLAEFTDELIFLKSIPPGIDEANCDPEEDIHLVERLLYDNSSPLPPKEFVSENSNAEIKYFSPSPIPVEDSGSFMEEIDLSFTPDDPMPPGIKDNDYDSEKDILIHKELLDNYSLSLLLIESYHFDILSFSRPPAKPPYGNTGFLNIRMMGDIFEQKFVQYSQKLEDSCQRILSSKSSFPQLQLGNKSRLESFDIVILFVELLAHHLLKVLVASKMGAAVVTSPAEVLELDTHSSSEYDPSDSSLPPVPITPMVSPFLCLDNSESDTELPERHIPTAPIPPASSAIVAPSTDIISPIDAPPGICRRRAILIRLGQDIPIGRLYRTHPSGPCRALIARKSVRPFPSHRLALRYTSHHLDRFTFESSSDHSSFDHSLEDHTSCHSTSDHSLSRHTSPVTTIADSSSPLRFVYPPPTRTLRVARPIIVRDLPHYLSCIHQRHLSHQLGILLLSHLPDHLARDVGPCYYCAFITSGALVPTHVDLLPPRNRFRDSYSLKDSVEEDIDAYVLADIKADATAVEVVANMDVEAEVDASIDVVARIEIQDGMLMPDAVECLEQNMTITRSGMTLEAIEELIAQRVAEVLATYEANRAAKMVVESQCHNGDDGDNGNGRGNGNKNGRGNGDGNGRGNRNENRGGNRNGNPNRNDRGVMHAAHECTYHDFVKCEPLYFKGTKGVVGLTRWFKKMETVFYISNCPEKYQVKYAMIELSFHHIKIHEK